MEQNTINEFSLQSNSKEIYRNLEDLPVGLSVEQMGRVLGISRSTAFVLANSKGFPVIRIGKRMIIPKPALIKWMEEQTSIGA